MTAELYRWPYLYILPRTDPILHLARNSQAPLRRSQNALSGSISTVAGQQVSLTASISTRPGITCCHGLSHFLGPKYFKDMGRKQKKESEATNGDIFWLYWPPKKKRWSWNSLNSTTSTTHMTHQLPCLQGVATSSHSWILEVRSASLMWGRIIPSRHLGSRHPWQR